MQKNTQNSKIIQNIIRTSLHGTPSRTAVVHGLLYDVVPTGYFEVLLTRRGGYALLRLHFQNTEKLLTEYIEGSSDEKYSRKERSLFSSSGDMWVQLFR